MTDPVQIDPQHDWRTEVNWPRVRMLALMHGFYWMFGAAMAGLYWVDLLVGPLRTILGIIGYIIWFLLILSLAGVVTRPRQVRGSAHMVSPQTFIILLSFMASLAAYTLLLGLIDLGTIILF